MSEYQYYEFQALDRRLTEAEMAQLRTLSSRVVLTSTSAIFTYHYGDFRGEPEAILGEYFDVMLYIANWGTRRLMFRFPQRLVDIETMRAYCVPGTITIQDITSYVVLDIRIDKEESEWVETGEGWLTGLISLRSAILEGDYRALYLAWLRACELELDNRSSKETEEDFGEDDDEYGEEGEFLSLNTPEPPVPPNMKNRDGALQSFIAFFEIDPLWVDVGAEASASTFKTDEPVEQWVASLPEAECRQLLLRAARGEPNIPLVIRKELREWFAEGARPVDSGKPRTAGQLLAIALERRRHATEEKRRQDEVARVRRLEALAQRETQTWDEVMGSIQQRNSKGYDQAVSLLRDLHELAEHRGEQAGFQRRVERIREQFPTLSGLKSRLVAARLIKR